MEEVFTRCPYKTSGEWLKERGKGIGGSDAPIILGLSNWSTVVELWNKKMARLSEEEYEEQEKLGEDNKFIVYGKKAEEHIRELFILRYMDSLVVTHTEEVLVNIKKPFLRASLDGEILVTEDVVIFLSDGNTLILNKGMRGILEIKTKYRPSKNEWRDSIPSNYYCQTLHYLNVTDYDFVIVVAELSFYNSSSTKYFGYMKNQKLEEIEYLVSEEEKFWKYVVDGVEPPTKIVI